MWTGDAFVKYSNEFIKSETLRLYSTLPQDEEERKKRLDVRDRIIELNYTFFGYVASHTYINNPSVTYEDKFQSALMHFCECWWWYQYSKKYRTDLSFAVFFKPRIGEMIERELNEVKYSIRRSLCMEVGKQLGKHWGQVKYEDLAKVNLPADKMNSLKAIFGSIYIADLADHENYMTELDDRVPSILDDLSDNYDSIRELLIHEMIESEEPLTDAKLRKLSEMYSIEFSELQKEAEPAKQELYRRLKEKLDITETF